MTTPDNLENAIPVAQEAPQESKEQKRLSVYSNLKSALQEAQKTGALGTIGSDITWTSGPDIELVDQMYELLPDPYPKKLKAILEKPIDAYYEFLEESEKDTQDVSESEKAQFMKAQELLKEAQKFRHRARAAKNKENAILLEKNEKKVIELEDQATQISLQARRAGLVRRNQPTGEIDELIKTGQKKIVKIPTETATQAPKVVEKNQETNETPKKRRNQFVDHTEWSKLHDSVKPPISPEEYQHQKNAEVILSQRRQRGFKAEKDRAVRVAQANEEAGLSEEEIEAEYSDLDTVPANNPAPRSRSRTTNVSAPVFKKPKVETKPEQSPEIISNNLLELVAKRQALGKMKGESTEKSKLQAEVTQLETTLRGSPKELVLEQAENLKALGKLSRTIENSLKKSLESNPEKVNTKRWKFHEAEMSGIPQFKQEEASPESTPSPEVKNPVAPTITIAPTAPTDNEPVPPILSSNSVIEPEPAVAPKKRIRRPNVPLPIVKDITPQAAPAFPEKYMNAPKGLSKLKLLDVEESRQLHTTIENNAKDGKIEVLKSAIATEQKNVLRYDRALREAENCPPDAPGYPEWKQYEALLTALIKEREDAIAFTQNKINQFESKKADQERINKIRASLGRPLVPEPTNSPEPEAATPTNTADELGVEILDPEKDQRIMDQLLDRALWLRDLETEIKTTPKVVGPEEIADLTKTIETFRQYANADNLIKINELKNLLEGIGDDPAKSEANREKLLRAVTGFAELYEMLVKREEARTAGVARETRVENIPRTKTPLTFREAMRATWRTVTGFARRNTLKKPQTPPQNQSANTTQTQSTEPDQNMNRAA